MLPENETPDPFENLLPHEQEALERAEKKFLRDIHTGNPYPEDDLLLRRDITGTIFSSYLSDNGVKFFSEKNRMRNLLVLAEQVWAIDWGIFVDLVLKMSDNPQWDTDPGLAESAEEFGLRLEGDTFSLGHHGMSNPTHAFLAPRLVFGALLFIHESLFKAGQLPDDVYHTYLPKLSASLKHWEGDHEERSQ